MVPVFLTRKFIDLVLIWEEVQAGPEELTVTLQEALSRLLLLSLEDKTQEMPLTESDGDDPRGAEVMNPTFTGEAPGFRACQEEGALPMMRPWTRETLTRFQNEERVEKLPALRLHPGDTG